MSLTKAWSLIVILLVAALAPLHVFAQVTANVSCLSPTYDWVHVFFFQLQDVGSDYVGAKPDEQHQEPEPLFGCCISHGCL
jgi:hypothetical protein